MGAGGQSDNRFSILVLILLAMGFPAAFGVGYGATQDTGQAIVIMALYGVVVTVAGFGRKVYEILEKRWAERVANNLDSWLVTRLARYAVRYRQYLIFRHRTFDVKGLSTQGPHSLNIEQVFVQLRLDSKAPHQASADPLACLTNCARAIILCGNF